MTERRLLPTDALAASTRPDARPLRESPLPPHLRAVEVLGRARGRVTYLAFDTQEGQEVVVKALLQPTDKKLPAAMRQRIVRQVRTLCLLDHPNIAQTRGVEQGPTGLFIARELAAGRPFAELAASGAFPIPAIVQVLRDIASALAAVHSLGAVHGGLSPHNVIVRETGTGVFEAKIVDLGLAPLRYEERQLQTLPDQDRSATGGVVPRFFDVEDDPRGDLHALGVMMYTALTGRPAVDSGEAALPTKDRPSVVGLARVFRPECPPLLSAIVDKLLSPALTECYQSAASLLADVDRYIERRDAEGADVSFPLGQLDAERVLGLTPPFVGRSREVDRLVDSLDEVQAGQGRIVFIHGDSGVGKSRLLREFAKTAEARGGVVLSGLCNETGVNPAFLPWREAIAGYPVIWQSAPPAEQAEKAERLQRVAGSLSAEVHQVLPALAPLIPKGEGAVTLDGSRQWQRHVDLVSRLVIELAHMEGFLVVILDDLQWADNESLEVLRYVMGRAARVPLLVIGAYRSDEVDADHPLAKIQREAQVARSRMMSIPIEPLSRDAIREMIVALVGEPGDALDHASDAVSRRSGGNALLAVHSVHSLLEERILKHRGGNWFVEHDRLEGQSAPASVIDVLLRRIGRIAPRYCQILARAAVVGRKVRVEAVTALANDQQEGLQALVTGVRGALLERIDDTTYRFVHDKVREAFLSALSPAEVRAAHRRLADFLETRLAEGEQVQLQLAMHRLESGDEREAYAASRRAGIWAWEHHENDAGIRLLMAAIERQPAEAPQSDERQLLESLGDCLTRVGRFDEALEKYRRTLMMHDADVDRARIERKCGGVYFGMGDSTHAVRHLERALGHLGTRLPTGRVGVFLFILRELFRQAAHTLLPFDFTKKSAQQSPKIREVVRIFDELARIYYFLDLPKTVAIHLRQLNMSEWIGHSPEMAMTYSSHGVVCATGGLLDRALDYQKRGLGIRESLEDAWGIGQSHCFMGVVRYSRSELDEAVDACLRGRKILRGLGDQWEIETVTFHLMLCHTRAGRLTEAHEEADRLLELSREIRDAKFEALALGGLALLEALRGDFRRGLQIADEAVKASPDPLSVVLGLGNKGLIYLQRGDFTSAREVLGEGWEMALRYGLIQDYTSVLATALAEATVLEAREKMGPMQKLSGAARRQAKRLCKKAERLGKKYPGHRPAALRARALFELACGSSKKAIAHFGESCRSAEQLGARFELARSEEELGKTLAELAHPDARKHIDKARALYEEMEAWSYRVRLARVTPEPGEPAATPQEPQLPTAARSSFLVKVARTLASTLDLDTLLANLASLALEHVGVDRVAIYLPGDDGGPLELRMSRGVSIAPPEEADAIEGAWDSCRTVNLPPRPEEAPGTGRPAMLAVPIPHREALVGVLYLHRAHGSAFGASEQGLMEILAAQAGMSIANATAYLTIARLNRHLERKIDEVAQRTTELEASRSALREQARGLEEEVQRRTESLQHTIAELEKANRLKREFLAAVSHELRTPMNAIICFTELVLEDGDVLDEEHQDSLTRVLSNAQHLLGLLEELLDLSRIERGRLELEVTETPLAPFLESVVTSVQPLFNGKPVSFDVSWPSILPSVYTDPRRLRQILINLVSNAAKFTLQGTVSFRVRLEADEVVFEVQDSGIGIHADDHEAIFEKFRQVDGSLARRGAGLGLGLSLSRELARMLGGDIELESVFGAGSTFRVTHPYQPATKEFDRSQAIH
ncbi:MAG: DUF2791 family P-loop domain-containing protein [Myxococcales bacterium]|nr:DUF2791 family P-loop domain-containing protein [Myxococcales bacterium]MCB9735808.1 DUF2791 family P-loop domain-containing protein [Deltaproteobacteria bacterium]